MLIKRTLTGVLLAFLNFLLLLEVTDGSCIGCVELDEVTFDKMLGKFQYALVKFDIAFPYGEKHEAYSEFAKRIGPKYDNLLVSLVGVKDYGEKENSKLADRFGVNEKQFPKILLFDNGTKSEVSDSASNDNFIAYPDDWEITLELIKKFVRKNTNIYIGLDGCLQEFDTLATKYVDSDEEQRTGIFDAANKRMEQLNNEKEKNSAKLYLVTMKRILEKGPNFIGDEERRLQHILTEKISDKKKLELTQRFNVLQSFHTKETLETGLKRDEF